MSLVQMDMQKQAISNRDRPLPEPEPEETLVVDERATMSTDQQVARKLLHATTNLLPVSCLHRDRLGGR